MDIESENAQDQEKSPQITIRPRLSRVNVDMILAALKHYVSFLDKHLARLEEDTTRFKAENQDKWLQAKERLNFLRMCSLYTSQRLERQKLEKKLGRPEELDMPTLEQLLNLRAKDEPGEYDKALLLVAKYFPHLDRFFVVHGMLQRGLISGYIDDEEKVWKARRLDIMRFASFLESSGFKK